MNKITSNKLRSGDDCRLKNWFIQKLLFLILLFGALPLSAQIHIGVGGTATNQYFPIYGLYDYSYSQQIVLASEYGAADGVAGPITQVKWKITTSTASSNLWNNWTVYLGHTNKTQFSNTTDYVPFSSLTQVYSGVITFEGADTWVTINIPSTSPFVYNGTDNLVVAVIENAPGWGSTPSFSAYSNSSTASRGIYGYQDGTVINIANPSSTSIKGITGTLAQIQFTGTLSPCPVPQNVVFSNITSTSAVATWTPNSNADSGVYYELRTSGAVNSGAVGLVASGVLASGVNTITFNDLASATNFSLYLKSNCSAFPSNWGPAKDFVTLCAPFTVINEFFDTTTVNALPFCWTSYMTAGVGASVYTSGSYSLSPSRSCYMYNGSTTTGDVMLISPVLNIPTTPMVLEFFVRGTAGYTLIVGKMTDPTNPATFTPISTITLSGSATTFNPYSTTINGGASYIAFKHGMGGTYRSLYIDDITLSTAPACPAVDNGSLNAINITYNQATLTWGSASNQFEIEYGPSGFAPGTGVGTIATSTTNSYVVTGLAQNTTYSYYVKSTCEATSPRRGPFSFTTMLVKPTPWYEGFATSTVPVGFTSNMSLSNVTNTNPGSTGYFYRYNIFGTGTASVANIQTVNVGPILAGDKLSFDYSLRNFSSPYAVAAPGIVNFDVQISTDYGNTYTSVSTFPNAGDEFWTNFNYTFPSSYVGQVVRVKVIATRIEGDSYLGIDNFYIGNCPLPTGIEIAKTDVTATLSWAGYTGNSYDIQYGVSGFAFGTGTTVNGVSNNHVINGLNGTTTYQVYVRNNCGANATPWIGPFSFTTETVVPSPWYETLNTSTIPTGFVSSFTSLTNSATIMPGAGSYYFYRNIYGTTATSAQVTTVNVGPVLAGDYLSFGYGFRNLSTTVQGAATLEVFISTDFGTNYAEIMSFDLTGDLGWQISNFALDSYVGEKIKMKFVYTLVSGDVYVTLDNFFVGPCGLPAIPALEDISQTSATLTWDGGTSDNYEIEYGPAGFTQGSGTIVVANSSGAVIVGLTQNTNYDYYIRKTCVGSNSIWGGKYSFKTTCDPIEGPFSEDFTSAPTGGSTTVLTLPDCWSFYDGGAGYGYTGTVALATPRSFQMYNNGDLINPYILVSPQTDNLGDGGYRVRFNARSGTSNQTLIFGTMTNPLDASTFVPLQTFNLPTTYVASPNSQFTVYLPEGNADYFAFKHGQESTYVTIYIDDVFYEEIPPCAPPINLSVEKNLVELTANLSWQAPSNVSVNNFEIEWGVAPFTQGSGTLTTSTTLNKEISGLTLGETYSFYVRRICATENTAWTGPFNFDMGYCTSIPTSNDGTGIGNVTIAGVVMNSPNDVMYEDFTNYDISFNSDELVEASITFNTGFTYGTNIWIDLNNNGVFENATELFFVGESLSPNPTTLDTSFTVPSTGNNVTGNYRMRIGTADSGQVPPNPCYSGSWGVTVDLLVNITFPCIQPTNLEVLEVGFVYANLDWEGQGNTGYELEYGLTGFTQGTGTVLSNISKPYTVEGLTPGATYDFYVRKICADVYSDWSTGVTTYVFCDTPEPTGSSSQTLVQDETLSQLVINGENLKFYTDPELTQEVPASTVLQVSGTYFVTQTINCESDSYLIVDVNVLPRIARPVVVQNQQFCIGATIGDIVVNSLPGAQVIWYETATSTQPLASTINILTGQYYVVQTDGITTSHRLLVNVIVNTVPPNLESQTLLLCGTYSFANVAINNLPGTSVKWYASPTSTTPIVNTSSISSGTYYVTQSYGICESERVPFQVSQFATLNKPIAGAQTFCGSGTVANLVAEGVAGGQILWYASATSNTVLSPQTALSTGTYYVAQTANGCYSERRAVSVRVVSLAAPQVSPFNICGGGTVAELYIPAATGVTFRWYTSPTSTYELPQITPLATGVYFVERVQNGCVSQRAAVQVTIGAIPAAPTGPTTQTYLAGATVSDLLINQAGVVWYSSYNDSQNGVNPLAANMPLVNGNTYYAVLIGENGCPSLPLAVNVNIYLSNDEFAKDELKYFPNPVEDILNITYSERIIQIEVFDLLGKRVKTVNTDNNNVELNLSDLSSGTYMIQLKSETKQQFIKVVKK